MNIEISILLEGIKGYQPQIHIYSQNDIYLEGVKLFSSTQTEFESDFLYMGYTSMLSNLIPENLSVVFLCIEDTPLPEKIIAGKNINILLIKNTEFNSVFNLVQDIFLAGQKVAKDAEKFLDSLINRRGLPYILDIGYELLKNPIIIVDMKGNLISHSSNIITNDPINKELLANGYLSKETIDFIHETDMQYLYSNKSYPHIYTHKKLENDRIVGRIFLDKRAIAFMVVWENENKFKKGDREIVIHLCKILSTEIQRNDFYKNLTSFSNDTFISDLLEGKITDNQIIMNRLKNKRNPKKNLFLLVIDFNNNNTFASIFSLRDMIELFITSYITFIYKTHILVLFDRDNESIQIETEMKGLIDFFKKHNIYAGLSDSFHQLADIPLHFNQAIKAIEIGLMLQVQSPVFLYENYKIFHFLTLSAPHVELINFCHPVVLEIIEYDKENKTDYAKTLYVYIINGKDYTSTAIILHTHQNTVLYRIKRIKELFNVDFINGSLLFQILLSFYILKLMDKSKGISPV